MNIINLHSQTDLSGLYIVYKGSTNFEQPGTYGVTHLLEHLACKGFQAIYQDLDNEGVQWNAYTSENEVVFYMQGLEESLAKFRQKFIDGITNYKINKRDLKSEKNIVVEEILDSFNNQFFGHQHNFIRKIYGNFGPTGKIEDVQNVDLDTCKELYKKLFSKPTKIINVSKSFKWDENFELSSVPVFPQVGLNRNKMQYQRYNHSVDRSTIMFLTKPIYEDFCYVRFIHYMLNGGLTSPMLTVLREKKGFVYSIESSVEQINDNTGYVFFGCETSNENTEDLKREFFKVLKNKKKNITKSRFNLTLGYLKKTFKKNEIERYDKPWEYIYEDNWNLEKNIDNITFEKTLEVYDKYFNTDYFLVSDSNAEFF